MRPHSPFWRGEGRWTEDNFFVSSGLGVSCGPTSPLFFLEGKESNLGGSPPIFEGLSAGGPRMRRRRRVEGCHRPQDDAEVGLAGA